MEVVCVPSLAPPQVASFCLAPCLPCGLSRGAQRWSGSRDSRWTADPNLTQA